MDNVTLWAPVKAKRIFVFPAIFSMSLEFLIFSLYGNLPSELIFIFTQLYSIFVTLFIGAINVSSFLQVCLISMNGYSEWISKNIFDQLIKSIKVGFVSCQRRKFYFQPRLQLHLTASYACMKMLWYKKPKKLSFSLQSFVDFDWWFAFFDKGTHSNVFWWPRCAFRSLREETRKTCPDFFPCFTCF